MLVINIKYSLLLVILFYLVVVILFSELLAQESTMVIIMSTTLALFPNLGSFSLFVLSGFVILAISNLLSLVCYSYPLTTTLSFNLSMALCLWTTSILLTLVKGSSLASLLPSNSPWYLVPFLCLVEVVSIVVRPVTLCFRLLANMSAGHILLTLICKMSMGLWTLGVLFGLLELMVSLVQAFVFLMLVTVYLEEAFSH